MKKKKNEDSLEPESLLLKGKTLLKRYSLSSNVLNTARRFILPAKQNHPTSKFGGSLYRLFDLSAMRTEFSHSSLTEPTKKAIKKWSEDDKVNGYQLIFILIPPPSDFNVPDFFDQVKKFLRDQEVDYIDLALLFNKKGWSREQLYWQKDQHMTGEGNRRVGLELSKIVH